MLTSTELRAEHKNLLVGARAIVESPIVSEADAARAGHIMAQADGLMTRIRATERLEAAANDLQAETISVGPDFNVPTNRLTTALPQELALIRSLAEGDVEHLGRSMPAEIRAEWNRRAVPTAAGGTTSPAGGGYAIAPSFMADLLVAMKAQGGMRAASHTFNTITGVALPWPTMDDRAQSGRLLTAENVQLPAAADVPFGSSTMGAYTFVSDVALVSYQLMQDSAFDFGALLIKALASRLARAENPYFTNGTGVNQPRGVLLDAPVGVTGGTGSTVTVSADNTLDLIASVDPVYRRGASWMMHDTTLQAYRKLKDSTDRYLHNVYNDPLNGGAPVDMVLGYPVTINQDMPVMAANAKSILFGAFDNYKIRTVVDLRLQVLRERFADAGQVGFIASIRSDGRLISGASPIKCYQNSAT